MAKDAPPTVDELSSFLTSGGNPAFTSSTVPSDAMLEVYLAAGITAFERMVGFAPVLAADEPSTKYLDPPVYGGNGWRLALPAMIVEAPETVKIRYDRTDVTSGTELDIHDEYELDPGDDDGPYSAITFEVDPEGSKGTVLIEARWGICPSDSIPEAVWLALLQASAHAAIEADKTSADGATKRIKEGMVEIEYDRGGNSSVNHDGLRRAALSVAERYRIY